MKTLTHPSVEEVVQNNGSNLSVATAALVKAKHETFRRR